MTECKKLSPQSNEALLSSENGFTAFSYGGYNIRFRAPYSLERYVDVLKWDDGYLVVLAKYSHHAEPEEEYIDLKPILEGLYIDSASFLKSINSVRVAYRTPGQVPVSSTNTNLTNLTNRGKGQM